MTKHITKIDKTSPTENGVIAPEKLIAGTAATRTWNAFTNARGNLHMGHWASGPCKLNVNYTEDEFCMLIKGACILTDETGNATRFETGEPFAIASGFVGTWESVGDVEKIYVILE